MFPRLYLHTYMFSRLKYCTTGSETYISEIYKMHFLNIGYNIIYCVYCILMLHNLYTIYIILFYTMYKQSQLYRYKTHTHIHTHTLQTYSNNYFILSLRTTPSCSVYSSGRGIFVYVMHTLFSARRIISESLLF